MSFHLLSLWENHFGSCARTKLNYQFHRLTKSQTKRTKDWKNKLEMIRVSTRRWVPEAMLDFTKWGLIQFWQNNFDKRKIYPLIFINCHLTYVLSTQNGALSLDHFVSHPTTGSTNKLLILLSNVLEAQPLTSGTPLAIPSTYSALCPTYPSFRWLLKWCLSNGNLPTTLFKVASFNSNTPELILLYLSWYYPYKTACGGTFTFLSKM